MAGNKAFGATNEPDTCLWCGTKLKQEYILRREFGKFPTKCKWCRSTNVEPKHTMVYCSDCYLYTGRPRVTVERRPMFEKKGPEGDGFFCRTRCGYQFGLALANHGRRLKPKQ